MQRILGGGGATLRWRGVAALFVLVAACSGHPATTPTPPPSGTWPNEPGGFRTWSDVDWSSLNPANWAWSFGEGGNGTLTADATAAMSPPSVLQIKFPIGFTGTGTEPAKVYLNDAGVPRPTQLYIGLEMKVSNPWQGHSSGVNKILFLDTGATTDALVVEMFGTAPPYHLQYAAFNMGVAENHQWLMQNVTNPEFTLGVWHKIEIYCKYSTTSSSYDGVVKTWLDGVLVMNYTDINWAHDGFGEQQIAPTWGGVDNTQTKTENDYYWIDHIRYSRP